MIIKELVPSSEAASFIAFLGKRLPPILITHSIIISQLNVKFVKIKNIMI
jgi:hypothetical protein